MRIQLGAGHLDRWTVFEKKNWFSIYIHRFNTVEQDRFHTHAFNAWAIVLRGGYKEQALYDDGKTDIVRIGPSIRFIGRDYNHRILRSVPNTWSIVFAGPWAKEWTETKDGIIKVLGWGRKALSFRKVDIDA